ncbi:MAG: DUF4854 domain-containing protein [Ruminococcus sp.]|nr:DUF4854 domain-containing protein [Ruminococcus sp.]
MKKLICLLLALLFCVSLAACGEKNSENSATKDSADSAAATVAPTASAKRFVSIDDYLNDPGIQQRIKESTEGGESVVKTEVYAEDNTLVYEYTYVEHYSEENVAVMKEKIDSALSDSAEVFTGVAEELRQYVDTENPRVKVVYCNDDGSVITEKVFE